MKTKNEERKSGFLTYPKKLVYIILTYPKHLVYIILRITSFAKGFGVRDVCQVDIFED